MTLEFGAWLPQGFIYELDDVPPAGQWSAIVAGAEQIEQLGYESVWLGDHLHPAPWRNHTRAPGTPRYVTPIFELWTTLAAISQRTSRLRLGQLTTAVTFRSPALLAKQAAMVDVMSGGRLELGIGAAWFEAEHRAYAFPFPAARDRIGMLREAVEIVRRMWTEPEVSYTGDHYTVVRAQCDPKPIQTLPPVVIGGSGKSTLRVVAELADKWNFYGAYEDFGPALAQLKQHCSDLGRDLESIRLTWFDTGVVVRATEAEAKADVAALRESRGLPPYRSWLWGTPEQVAEKLAPFVAAGVREFHPQMPEFPSAETRQRFIAEVAPELRRLAPARTAGKA